MKIKKIFQEKWAYLFILIPIILQVIFFFGPFFKGVYYSFTDWSGLTSSYNFVKFENYKDILSDKQFISSIKFTTFYTIAMVIGKVVLGLLLAVFINKKIKGASFFKTIYFFPAVVSTVTLGLIFKQIFNYGVIPFGEYFNIEWLSQNLLASNNTVFGTVVFVSLWQGLAIPIVLFISGLQSIPEEIKEAATIDGANRWQMFRSIEWPYLTNVISMVVILAVKAGITAFDLLFSLTNGGPNGRTTSLGMLVYNNAFKNNKFGYASAISVVLFTIIAVISLTQIYVSQRKEKFN